MVMTDIAGLSLKRAPSQRVIEESSSMERPNPWLVGVAEAMHSIMHGHSTRGSKRAAGSFQSWKGINKNDR